MTTYYGIEIYTVYDEDRTYFEFCVGGWCFEAETLEQAKKEIKEWR